MRTASMARSVAATISMISGPIAKRLALIGNAAELLDQ
jgi:hypothetical protein